ncbi:MAG TPA: hypothetical protein VJ725_08685, partial [Thermoanaerobaculia bacterium]|nr:hypothetical protein [Thermoanaerobaculia bacterium]
MRPDAAEADRNAAVRKAARAWKKAGVIDDAALAKIEAACPDDRVRVGPVFRVLLFIFTLVGINAGFGFILLFFSDAGEYAFATLALVVGAGLVFLTELQTGLFKRAQGGTEAATSFAALGFLAGGSTWIFSEMMGVSFDDVLLAELILLTLLCAAAAWRWGYPFYAAVSVATLLGVLAHLPAARLFWIALAVLAAPVLLRLEDSPRLPPALRASATAALVTALAGLYIAVNLQSFDLG